MPTALLSQVVMIAQKADPAAYGTDAGKAIVFYAFIFGLIAFFL